MTCQLPKDFYKLKKHWEPLSKDHDVGQQVNYVNGQSEIIKRENAWKAYQLSGVLDTHPVCINCLAKLTPI